MRPSDPKRYIRADKPCPKCGTFWRLPNRARRCVECARRHNARQYAKRKGNADEMVPGATKPRSVSEIQLGFRCTSYQSSPTALERSRYLDSLIRQRSGLETKQETPRVMTAGDLHRASLPVGVKPRDTSQDHVKLKSVRDAENEALAAAIEKILPTMPDLITCEDVLAAVPPDFIETITPSRRHLATALILKKRGIPKIKSLRDGRLRLYAVRNIEQWQQRTVTELLATHAQMHGLPEPRDYNRDRPPSARQMALARGEPTYQREEPCSRCGGTLYQTNNHGCVACKKARRSGSRARARAAGATTYEGAQCAACGGTTRLTRNHRCVACSYRVIRATGIYGLHRPTGEVAAASSSRRGKAKVAAAASSRAAAMAKGETIYVGVACPHCGGTTRHVAGYQCVNCHEAKRSYRINRRRRMVVEGGLYNVAL